ncbi:GNAT family N-acetyltransferase [Wolbachia endosymbiont of Cantharis cryptica]|uniref:GNAT family N-acetyltransferase n=1 Tax=Wolbachia endosymbiont of Cantharis cryptica TaxID=3066132 RepID=UPI00376EDFE7
MLEKIKQNTFSHFKYLPEAVGFSVKTDQALTIINCGLGSSMFNIVCGDCHAEKVQSVINEFKGQPFAWWIIESKALSRRLLEHGFITETEERAMLCDLTNFKSSNNQLIRIEQVLNLDQLEHFTKVLETYDATARSFYERLTKPLLSQQEKLFVGYENNIPVVIAILFISGDTAGIFSLITRENKRGLGYGTQMMTHLMGTARRSGIKHTTLSASSDSGYRIYECLGFRTFGQFECFEWRG